MAWHMSLTVPVMDMEKKAISAIAAILAVLVWGWTACTQNFKIPPAMVRPAFWEPTTPAPQSLTVEYDKFKDRTSVTTPAFDFGHLPSGDATPQNGSVTANGPMAAYIRHLILSTTCSYPGHLANPSETSGVETYFVFTARSDWDWSFAKSHDALILVADDDKRIIAPGASYGQKDKTPPASPGPSAHSTYYNNVGQGTDAEMGLHWEKMEFKISADDFRKLAHADTIEGEIGGCQFTFPGDQIEAIHQMA